MAIITPETSPEGARIGNLRMEIILAEQKVKQLQDAERYVKGEIQQAHDTKSQVQTAINALIESKSMLEKSVEELSQRDAALKSSIDSATLKLAETNRTIADKEADMASKSSKLESDIASFEGEKRKHYESADMLAQDKASHELRVERLLNAIK